MHILPVWAKRRYDQIERADVIELVEAIVKKGTPVQANRVQALVSMIFSFAVDAALVKFNPCSRLRKRGAETREPAFCPMKKSGNSGVARCCHQSPAVSGWHCGSRC